MLQNLPCALVELTELCRLDARDNPLQIIPEEIGHLTSLYRPSKDTHHLMWENQMLSMPKPDDGLWDIDRDPRFDIVGPFAFKNDLET